MKLYVDSEGKIEAEALRLEVSKQLAAFNDEVVYLINPNTFKFWEKLHNLIANKNNGTGKEDYLRIEAQLRTLPEFLNTWKRTAVESPERWEMFILTKAQEIRSGNRDSDYFWALAIRHDQIVALIRVLERLEQHIKKWMTMKPAQVLEDGVFWGLSAYSLEKQIYMEAEKVHQERLQKC